MPYSDERLAELWAKVKDVNLEEQLREAEGGCLEVAGESSDPAERAMLVAMARSYASLRVALRTIPPPNVVIPWASLDGCLQEARLFDEVSGAIASMNAATAEEPYAKEEEPSQ